MESRCFEHNVRMIVQLGSVKQNEDAFIQRKATVKNINILNDVLTEYKYCGAKRVALKLR